MRITTTEGLLLACVVTVVTARYLMILGVLAAFGAANLGEAAAQSGKFRGKDTPRANSALGEITPRIPVIFVEGGAPWVRVLMDGPPNRQFKLLRRNGKWEIDTQSVPPQSVPDKYMVVGKVKEGTQLVSADGKLYIGDCQVVWQTSSSSQGVANTPVAEAGDCSVAVEVERRRGPRR